MDRSPWTVHSIQEFSCFKCPECDYFNKEEIYFEDHAISNHPLSSVLFDKIKSASTFEVMVKQEMLDGENHISVSDVKEEPIDSFEEDPLNFNDTNVRHGEHFMTLNTEPDLSDIPNPKVKPVKQKRKQSHVEIRNDYDKIVAFDNESKVLKNHKHYQCLNCKSKFHGPNSRALFRKHLTKSQEDDSMTSCNGQYEITCDNCKFKCKADDSFKTHFESEHEPKRSQSENQSKKRTTKKNIAKRNYAFGQPYNHQAPISNKPDTLETEQVTENYSCTLCDYKTDNGHKLWVHLGYQFSCNDCGKKFHGKKGKQEIKIHWKTEHSKSVNPPLKFQSDGHIEIEHEFPCNLCNYKSHDEHDFKNHIESAHGKSYDCSFCEFKNNSKSKFNSHLKNHKHYQCLNCKKYFHGLKSRTLFKMHLQKSQEDVSINRCNGKNEITCDICKFKYNEENTFNTHFESEHEQKNSESHACSICNFKAPSIAKLIYHLKTHYKRKFSLMNTDEITIESQPNSSNDMSCETILVDSELQNNPKLFEKSLQCPKCSFKTSLKHNLDRHIKFHNDCSYCGKVFLGSNGKRALATHMNTHQVKPKKQKLCIFCNRDYKNWPNMNRHENLQEEAC